MAKAADFSGPVAITANDLRTGRVLYRAPGGTWVPEIERAEIARDPAQVAAALEAAKIDHDSGVIVEPFAVAFDAAARAPSSLRERIRAQGPTVRPPGE
jgi:hypothetical protein